MSKTKVKNQPYVQWNAHRNPFVATKFKIGAVVAAGLCVSIAVSFLADRVYQAQLQSRSVSFAQSVSASEIDRLKSEALPDELVPYEQLKQKLSRLKAIYGDTRFVYVMDERRGDVRFLADSETIGSDTYSPRLQQYDHVTSTLREVFSSGSPAVEGPVQDDYGLWYSSLAPIKDDDGNVAGIIGVDVPASHYFTIVGGLGGLVLLATLIWSVLLFFYDRQRNRRFESFRLQVELMSIASHELRTPLSGIRWGQEVLLSGKLDETQQAMTQAMYDSTLQLQESIEDILQLAAIGKKSKQSVRIPVNIAELIESTLKVQQLPAQQKEIAFVYDKMWIDPIMAEGDATQLRRVFNNLVSNAIKYASIGSAISMTYEQKDGNHLVVIKNQGIGVPQKELAHIFDGFYRASNAIEKQVNGTGMGLYLSRQTIEQHGGKLWIESVENESTTAYVLLPMMSEGK